MVDEETLVVAFLREEAEKEERKRRKKHRRIWVTIFGALGTQKGNL
jgi:hypothetical protein